MWAKNVMQDEMFIDLYFMPKGKSGISRPYHSLNYYKICSLQIKDFSRILFCRTSGTVYQK